MSPLSEELNAVDESKTNMPSGQRERLFEDMQHVREGAGDLAAALNETLDDANQFLRERLETMPWQTLGAAAAVGFVLGGGLASSISRLAIAAVGRAALSQVLRSQVLGGTTGFQTEDSEEA